MTSDIKKYAVDVDNLGIDWDRQARRIASAVAERRRPTPLVTWRRAMMATAALLIVGLVGIVAKHHYGIPDGRVTYSYANTIESYDVPLSFKALNGYAELDDDETTYIYSDIYY